MIGLKVIYKDLVDFLDSSLNRTMIGLKACSLCVYSLPWIMFESNYDRIERGLGGIGGIGRTLFESNYDRIERREHFRSCCQ